MESKKIQAYRRRVRALEAQQARDDERITQLEATLAILADRLAAVERRLAPGELPGLTFTPYVTDFSPGVHS